MRSFLTDPPTAEGNDRWHAGHLNKEQRRRALEDLFEKHGLIARAAAEAALSTAGW